MGGVIIAVQLKNIKVMITDKVVWPDNFCTEKAEVHVGESIAVDNMSAVRLWPFLTNVSNWNRYCPGIVSAEFMDPSIQDPHLFKRAEFRMCTDYYEAFALVLDAVEPKADRPGRLAIKSEIRDKNGSEVIMTTVHEVVLSVSSGNRTTVISEVNAFGPMAKSAASATRAVLSKLNNKWVSGMIKYALEHNQHTSRTHVHADHAIMG